MKKIFTTIFLVFAVNASALLSPFWQSATEIEAMLKCKELGRFFYSGEEIREISKDGNFYLIRGDVSSCMVEVVYLPSDMIGPAQFELIFY